jgi:hypothetical protein
LSGFIHSVWQVRDQKLFQKNGKLLTQNIFLVVPVPSVDNLEENVKEILKKNIFELPESVAPFLCYKDDGKYKDAYQ